VTSLNDMPYLIIPCSFTTQANHGSRPCSHVVRREKRNAKTKKKFPAGTPCP
jgi:hypothetical protein